MMQWLAEHWSWSGAIAAAFGSAVLVYLKSTSEIERARYEVLSSDMTKVLAQLARLEDRLRSSERPVRDHSAETRESNPPPVDRV